MHSLEYATHDLRKDVNELNNYTERSVNRPSLDVIKSTMQMKDQANEQHKKHIKPLYTSKRDFKKYATLLLFLLENVIKYQQYSIVSQKDTETSWLLIKILCQLLGIDE